MNLSLFLAADFPLPLRPQPLHFLWTLWISETGKTMILTPIHLTAPPHENNIDIALAALLKGLLGFKLDLH